MTPTPDDVPPIGTAAGEVAAVRPFDEFLREQRRGGTIHDATVALAALVKAIETTGKAGSIQLTLKLKPDKKYGTAVEVADSIVVKLPEADKPSSLFFMDGSGSLVRHDPGQTNIHDALAAAGADNEPED